MVDLGVLPHDFALVARLLDPLHARVFTTAAHRAGKRTRTGAGHHQAPGSCHATRYGWRRHNAACPRPRGRRCRRGIADHRIAQCGVQRHALVHHRHHFRRGSPRASAFAIASWKNASSDPETKNRLSTPPSFIAATSASDHSSPRTHPTSPLLPGAPSRSSGQRTTAPVARFLAQRLSASTCTTQHPEACHCRESGRFAIDDAEGVTL